MVEHEELVKVLGDIRNRLTVLSFIACFLAPMIAGTLFVIMRHFSK